jgi:hypothetical protein
MDWSIPPHLNVDLAWSHLREKIDTLVEKFVPLSRKNKLSNGPPWFNSALKALLKERKKAWDRFKLSQTLHDYQSYKRLRNECTQLKRKNRSIYETKIAENVKTSPKTLFNYLQRRNKSTTGIPPLRSHDSNELITEDADKANLLASQFASVFTIEDDILHFGANEGLQDIPFEIESVKSLLLTLKPSSAPGPDDIHPLFLRAMADFLAEPLFHIFRLSLDCGQLPVEWKVGVIKPIFKGGEKSNPQNYRPVCLTAVTCKIMEKLIKKALQEYLEFHKKMNQAQHGFRKQRSCISNLLTARERWGDLIDTSKSLDVIFIDFSKAFDKVPHQRLLWKLNNLGISGKVLSWIADFLRERTMWTHP